MVLAHRAEDVLAHVAPILRRLRTLLLVVTITIPLFLVGIVAVLWHLAY
jgi:CHASE3 domain sensor protein